MSLSFSERKAVILEMLMEESNVSVSALSRHLDVTPVTARSDLAALEKQACRPTRKQKIKLPGLPLT